MSFTPNQTAGLAAIVVCVVLIVIVWLDIEKKKKKKTKADKAAAAAKAAADKAAADKAAAAATATAAATAAATATGTPCTPTNPAPTAEVLNRVLYKYDTAGLCKPTGCKISGQLLNTTTGDCEVKLAAGQPCTPATGAVEGHSFKYYNILDDAGNIVYDDTGKLNPKLICEDTDITNVTDKRIKTCSSVFGLTLPTGVRYTATSALPDCPVECVPNKKVATGRYAPTDRITACTQDTTCVDDGTQLPSLASTAANATNTHAFGAGAWGSCPVAACKNGYFGPICNKNAANLPSIISDGAGYVSGVDGLKTSDNLFLYAYDGVDVCCYYSETIPAVGTELAFTVWKKHPNVGSITTFYYGVDASGSFYIGGRKFLDATGWSSTTVPNVINTFKKMGLKTIPIDSVKIPHIVVAAYGSDKVTILGHFEINLTSTSNFTSAPAWKMSAANPF
jgi:hypothetical protein